VQAGDVVQYSSVSAATWCFKSSRWDLSSFPDIIDGEWGLHLTFQKKKQKKTFIYIETKLCDRLKSLVQSPSELEGFSNEKIRWLGQIWLAASRI